MPARNGTGIELLADPTRRRIVALLAQGHLQSAKVAAKIGLSRPATSRQLRLLQHAGLISRRKHYVDGRRIVYFIDPKQLGQIAAWLAGTEVGRAFPHSDRPTPDRNDGST
jgi:DNA-binding transcriptional ArsR family regulator